MLEPRCFGSAWATGLGAGLSLPLSQFKLLCVGALSSSGYSLTKDDLEFLVLLPQPSSVGTTGLCHQTWLNFKYSENCLFL